MPVGEGPCESDSPACPSWPCADAGAVTGSVTVTVTVAVTVDRGRGRVDRVYDGFCVLFLLIDVFRFFWYNTLVLFWRL